MLLFSGMMPAADKPSLGQVLDGRFAGEEHDIVSLIEAMPANKFNFAPTMGEFKGVRTFARQATHMATAIYMMSSAILEQKPPVDIGTGEDGPTSLQTKEQILNYVKGAFAFGHKALLSITEKK